MLIVLAHESPMRILCTREIQGSIKESAYRLLCDQIDMLGLTEHFVIGADSITHKNGSRFFFEGLRFNASKIRSYEDISICWVEEAQAVSEFSWETLLPTIRKPGSRLFISFNPLRADDPVYVKFVAKTPPGCIARKVSYRDNPHFSAESEAERAWLEQTDHDSYMHVWEGETRTISDAQVFKNKFEIESFGVNPDWAGPYHGVDFGFSKDPSAGVRCHIDDQNRVLYISKEFWKLGCDIDALAGELETAIPGISKHTTYCDSSRPETISYLSRSGIPNARAAEKWPGSVDDGVMYLRSFAKIVIDPSCVHTIDEFRSYSFKTDRLTGAVLPAVEDRHNHIVDALRYSVFPLIRNQSSGGYFNRSAMLVDADVVDVSTCRPDKIIAVLSTTERPGTAAGLIVLAVNSTEGPPLTVLHYDLVEIDRALDVKWFESVFVRMRELSREWNARAKLPELWVEDGDTFGQSVATIALQHAVERGGRGDLLNVRLIEATDELPPSIDDRVHSVRNLVNSGRCVKLARSVYAQSTTFRSSTSNHLVSQLFGFKPGMRDVAQELVLAFSTAVLISTEK